MAEIHEIADGIYRIATFIPPANLTFNQFVIVDDKPLLFHTGQRLLFPQTLDAVRRLIDPGAIRYISWSHWEADESGALNQFLEAAPQAEPVHGQLGVRTNVNDFAIRPARAVKDGEVLELGRHRLRFLITPHVPHAWDAILAYEETTGLLLASDLFTQRGERTPVTDRDMTEQTIHSYVEIADELGPYIPIGPHTARVLDRLEKLQPKRLACMHGPAFSGNAVEALRNLRTALFAMPEGETATTGIPAS
jgi:flavorubredoxin